MVFRLRRQVTLLGCVGALSQMVQEDQDHRELRVLKSRGMLGFENVDDVEGSQRLRMWTVTHCFRVPLVSCPWSTERHCSTFCLLS